MLSPKTRRNLNRIIPFGVMWLLFSFIYLILERGLLGNLNHYPTSGNSYDFGRNLLTIPILAVIIGIVIGVLEIFYFSKWFMRKSFSNKIIGKSLIYFLIILILLIVIFLTAATDIQAAITTGDFWLSMWSFFCDYSFAGILAYMASIIVFTQFYTEVSESIGTNKLRNFFLGRYYKPVVEERIFMFLDMKSSTAIAEKLGHSAYFLMLQDYFSDLSDSVISFSGEIYQYAGDEMILTWKLEQGLKDNNCIRCFFAMKEALLQKSGNYIESYGLTPGFKAGLHCGTVTTGEIGVLKKEIIFTGDVLNTTARIEGLCNQYNVDILISGIIKEKLDISDSYQVSSVGVNALRGKDQAIELFTVTTYE